MTKSSTNPTLAEIAGLIRSIDIGPDASRLLIRVARLIARGRPVPHDQVAGVIDDLDIDWTEALKYLTAYAERDDNGDIIGAGPGITLRHTPHRFTTDAAQVWAWCAMDTLILPAVLNREARVASQPPGSKEIIRFTATPDGVSNVEPAGAVVSMPGLVPGTNPTAARRLIIELAEVTAAEQIWAALCHDARAFGSLADAQRHFAGRDDVAFLSLSEAFGVLCGFTERFHAYETEPPQETLNYRRPALVPGKNVVDSRELVRFVQALGVASSYAELERVFIEGFGRVMSAPMYGLRLSDPDTGRVLHNSNVNISDACIACYEQAGTDDPLLAYAMKTGRAAYNMALMSMEEWLASPVYRKALHLHDMRHTIKAPVIDARGVVGTLYVATSDPEGSYGSGDVELAETIGRLIGGVVDRIEAMERLERERDHAQSALDLIGTAVVISDPKSLKPHLNNMARRLVAEVVNGEEHLHRLIARPGRAGGFSRRTAVELAAGGRGVLHAHSSNASRVDAGLITVLELERGPANLSNRALNALTAREREIAILVTEGLSDRDIAERVHLSHHTVSQYIKQIYRKLHVDSRVALTRLLLTSHSLGENGRSTDLGS